VYRNNSRSSVSSLSAAASAGKSLVYDAVVKTQLLVVGAHDSRT
jgi:hypothetical protein